MSAQSKVARDFLLEIALENEDFAFIGFDSGAKMEAFRVGSHLGEGFGAHRPSISRQRLRPVRLARRPTSGSSGWIVQVSRAMLPLASP